MILNTCPSCGFANDATRVFCHQCNSKLNRLDPAAKPLPPPVPAPRRPAKPAAGEGFRPVSLIFSIVRIGIFAALLAALLLCLRPPADIPAPAQPDPALVAALQDRYAKTVASSPGPRQLILTSEELNTTFATQVTVRQNSSLAALSTSTRPFLALNHGTFTLGLEILAVGQRVVLQSEFAVEGNPGHLTARMVRAQIGHLVIPPPVAPLIMRWTQTFANAFSRQLQEIEKAEKVVIGPGNVQIIWPPNP
ncbi:MAG TPA: zinc ribbon domain-containing protein [Chthoniobacterales bacterium]